MYDTYTFNNYYINIFVLHKWPCYRLPKGDTSLLHQWVVSVSAHLGGHCREFLLYQALFSDHTLALCYSINPCLLHCILNVKYIKVEYPKPCNAPVSHWWCQHLWGGGIWPVLNTGKNSGRQPLYERSTQRMHVPA